MIGTVVDLASITDGIAPLGLALVAVAVAAIGASLTIFGMKKGYGVLRGFLKA